MKRFFSKYGNEIIFSFIVIVCLIFFVSIIAQEKTYMNNVEEQAIEKAEIYASEQETLLNAHLDGLKMRVEVLAAETGDCESIEEVMNVFRSIRAIVGDDDDFRTAGYFIDNKLYNAFGEEIDISGYTELNKISPESRTIITRAFQYENNLMAIAVSAKVDAMPTLTPEVDRVALIYGRTVISPFIYSDKGTKELNECFSHSEMTLFCKHDGRVLEQIINKKDYNVTEETVQEGVLKEIVSDNDSYLKIKRMINNGENGNIVCRIGSDNYVIAVNRVDRNNGDFFLLNMFNVSLVYGIGYSFINSIWTTLSVFFLLMIFISVYFIVSRIKIRKKIFEIGTIDPHLNCPTLINFNKTAEEIMRENKGTQFVIGIAHIHDFSYITERFNEDISREILCYARDVYKNSLLVGETYGYIADGEFALLMHYKDKKSLMDRLTGISARISRYTRSEDTDFKIRISFSLYEITKEEKRSVSSMVEKAMATRRFTNLNVNNALSCNFYSDVLKENYINKAEIEGEMESALKNGEFQIFYQPKFSYEKNRIDGAEILVRWYNAQKEKFYQPNSFLPVFEKNGFINKLDRYVFKKACKNIVECLEKGLPTYPISVNISRVTAVQPDFVQYYTDIKNKYKIVDNFITLEFTESFAYENYEYLDSIVKKLHANGFYCSIDDFGTGYSSYNLLKKMDMDEVKLDKVFLESGLSEERDDAIFESVIGLVKGLGMTVTQEGVTTKEEFLHMKELGCDLIQGFYYAKPMNFTDYCAFVKKKNYDLTLF